MTEKKKRRQKPLTYFFYNGDLHKKVHINRSKDVITAWNYPKGKVAKYVYSDVRKNGEMAFTSKQVGEMVDRTPANIALQISRGNVRTPQHTYGLDENRNFFKYMWCEKDIMDLHAYLSTVHIGRPRKDGEISTRRLPSATELRAMIRQGTVLYVKNEDGEFVPTWQAEKF